MTLFSAGLFALLSWAFANGLYADLWNGTVWTNSAAFTYMFILLILAAGYYQAQRLPDKTARRSPAADPIEDPAQVDDPRFWKLLMGNVYVSLIWLPLRFFVGREWLAAGEDKLRAASWMDGGTALKGYWTSAIAVPQNGRPPITYNWYRDSLRYMLNHEWYTWFGPFIAIGETVVGIALIIGALVGIAAFFGTLMNFSYQLAGSASSNPVLFGLSVFLILAWKVAGYWGIDRWLLSWLGAPWRPGSVFQYGGKEPLTSGREHEPA